MEIQSLVFSDIPQKILGRLKKDGTPDMRFKNSIYMLEQYLKQASGISDQAGKY